MKYIDIYAIHDETYSLYLYKCILCKVRYLNNKNRRRKETKYRNKAETNISMYSYIYLTQEITFTFSTLCWKNNVILNIKHKKNRY